MSTEKFPENEEMLKRLHSILDDLGLKRHGRGTEIAEKTGYSRGQVSGLLSGKAPLNDRFLKTLCQTYSISEQYIRTGLLGNADKAVEAGGETEDAILAKLRKLLPPEKRILFDEIVKMSNEEAEAMLRDHIARMRNRLEKGK